MLKKVNRLAKSKDIKTAFAKGRTFFSPLLNVKFSRDTVGKRFAVVVSTKVSKLAVKRNRLKRVVREGLKKDLAEFPEGSYIIMVKPLALSVKESQIFLNLAEIRKKISQWKRI